MLSTRKDRSSNTALEIAIIGMAGRFPGARNINRFWENLKKGVESITFFSDEELKEAGVSSGWLTNPNYVKSNGSLLEDKEYFDAFFFGYTAAEAELMDPQLRVFHECAWEALENSGYGPYSYDGLIGIYAGASANFNWEAQSLLSDRKANLGGFALRQLTNREFLCLRLSYKLNLKGPALTLQTACSTSLAAIHTACRSLLTGECSIALAGGVSISYPYMKGNVYQDGMIMSADSHCRVFDARANGTVSGEGVGVVVLKRVKYAHVDRDHIYAVILGSAINNDGYRKVGFTAPSIEGQADVIRTVFHITRAEPESISYIEAHGTGTSLGDPVEVEALKQAFNTEKKGYCAIGSVKSNIGHLDAAAGIVGFIKTVMALYHKQIPPSLHFETPNPEIDFQNSPFYVNRELREWENNQSPRRAGISSFGIGGTNVHVILEEAPITQSAERKAQSAGREYQLILLSAKTQTALDKMTVNLAEYLKKNLLDCGNPGNPINPGLTLADAAYTLQVGRVEFNHRRMLVCSHINEAVEALSAVEGRSSEDSRKVHSYLAKNEKRPVIFIFSGLGSQYVNMGQQLYQKEPVFRKEMDRCFDILKGLAEYNIKEILYTHPGCRGGSPCPPQDGVGSPGQGDHRESPLQSDQISQTDIAQLVVFIFEYALANLLMAWGIKPQAMMGYSFGEYTAACLAGVFSLEDALKLVVTRGKLIKKVPGGAMLSVPLEKKKLVTLLNPGLSLAIDNGPSCIVSGPADLVAAFESQMKEKRLMCMRVETEHALHSKMMVPILKDFQEAAAALTLNKPQIRYISNVSGDWLKDPEAVDPGYWASHLGQTVRFADGMNELKKIPGAVFLEIGPGHDISTLILRDIDNKSGHMVLDLVRDSCKEVSDLAYLLRKIGRLWLYGVKIDWSGFYQGEKRYRVPLPGYPFERELYRSDHHRFQKDSRVFLEKAGTGKKADIADWFYLCQWERSQLDPDPLKIPGQSYLLVFMNRLDFCSHLLKRLNQEGKKLILVEKGEVFSRQDAQKYTINPGQPDHYHLLMDELQQTGMAPVNIVHLWAVSPDGNNKELEKETLDKAQDAGLYSILYLVQALAKKGFNKKINIHIVSNHLHEVIGNEESSPQKASVLGLAKIVPQEFLNIKCRCIDIVLPKSRSRQQQILVEQLAREFFANSFDTIIAYRGNYRWVETFKPVRLEKVEGDIPRLKEEGVYLITGGLGNIGFILAKYLARTRKARLILTGRTVLPPPTEWEDYLAAHEQKDSISRKISKVRELENMGSKVMAFSADTADERQMQRVIHEAEERLGPINGIIHAAGILDARMFKSIGSMTREDFLVHFRSKVYGLLVLQELFRDKSLDFCLLISSLSPILGGLGMAAYASANAFMDAFVYWFNRNNRSQWMSVNWGEWESEEKNDKITASAAPRKEWLMTPAQGMETFPRILNYQNRQGVNQVVVSALDLQDLIDKWVRLEALKDKPADKEPVSFHHRPDLSNPYEAPRTRLEQLIADTWQAFFSYDRLGIHDDFFELGGDSLLGIRMVNKFKELLGEFVYVNVLFEAPTIARLAAYLSENYPLAVARLTGEKISKEEPVARSRITARVIAKIRKGKSSLLPRKKTVLSKNPPAVFILSPPRCGSTLLRVILGGHPRLFAPPEMNVLAYDTLKDRVNPDPAFHKAFYHGPIQAIMQARGCQVEEAQAMMEEFENQAMPTKEFFGLLQQWIGERLLVDKSVVYSTDINILGRIEAEFEKPLYIHLVRHPYGMIRSYQEARLDIFMGRQWKDNFTRMELGELLWLAITQNILDFLGEIPRDRQHRIKFEELVSQPQVVVNGICEFLGLEFDPEMLQPYKEKKKRMTDGIQPEGMMQGDPKFHHHNKIDPQVADTWKKQYQVDFLSSVTWQTAKIFGYEPIHDPGPGSPPGEITRLTRRPHHQASILLKEIHQLPGEKINDLLNDMLAKQKQ